MSEKFCGRKSGDKRLIRLGPIQSLMRSGSVRAGILTALLSSGCAGQKEIIEPTTPTVSSTTTDKTATLDLSPVNSDTDHARSIGDMVISMTIFGKPNRKPWPDVATTCIFTGVVLEHDRMHVPPRIMLENICLQKQDGKKNTFEGQNLWSEADYHGHFKVPFQHTHIEYKNGRLVFVTEFEGSQIEKDLIPGNHGSNTLSFEHSLVRYRVQSIKK